MAENVPITREQLAEHKARVQQVIDAFPTDLESPDDVSAGDQLFAEMMQGLTEAGAPVTVDFLLGVLTFSRAVIGTLSYAGAVDTQSRQTLMALIGTFAITEKYVIERLETML